MLQDFFKEMHACQCNIRTRLPGHIISCSFCFCCHFPIFSWVFLLSTPVVLIYWIAYFWVMVKPKSEHRRSQQESSRYSASETTGLIQGIGSAVLGGPTVVNLVQMIVALWTPLQPSNFFPSLTRNLIWRRNRRKLQYIASVKRCSIIFIEIFLSFF